MAPVSSQLPTRADDALHLLAGFYARRCQMVPTNQPAPLANWRACERIYRLLEQASGLVAADEQLVELAGQIKEEHVRSPVDIAAWHACIDEARGLIAQVLRAGGNAQVLVAGVTDGVLHFCARCSQDEYKLQQVRNFDQHRRRVLLKAEVRQGSLTGRCQACRQVVAADRSVVLVPVGTVKHESGCRCATCNRAGLAWLVHLYGCDDYSLAVQLPALAQIAAPSLKQARARAFALCWQRNWYVLCDQPPR